VKKMGAIAQQLPTSRYYIVVKKKADIISSCAKSWAMHAVRVRM
jgi:hypothetical protein